MIIGEYTIIRTAEPDDVYAMRRYYRPVTPRACFLDRKRELTPLTTDELRETFQSKEIQSGLLYAIEDKQGAIRGFGVFRRAHVEVAFGEIAMMFPTEADYGTAVAAEALAFLCDYAFMRNRLNKIVAQCLDSEHALRASLVAAGFRSDGVQRDTLYARGRWFSLESLSLHSGTYQQRRSA